MQAITIKDFAEAEGVSYEAIRKSVMRYKDEMQGHVFQRNRVTYLDETAVEYLKKRRKVSPVVIHREDKQAEERALRDQLEDLRSRYEVSQEKLVAALEHVQELQGQVRQIEQKNVLLIEQTGKAEQDMAEAVKRYAEEKARADVATIRADAYQAKVDAMEGRLADAEARATAAEEEAGSYKRGLFGFYRKRRP